MWDAGQQQRQQHIIIICIIWLGSHESHCFYAHAWFEESGEVLLLLLLEDHSKILRKGLCLWCLRLAGGWLSVSPLSICHITCTSWYPHVCTSSWSFKSPSPFLRSLTRVETASQTRRTGKIILSQKSINLSFVTFTFFLPFLFPPLTLTAAVLLLIPARPALSLSLENY